MASIFTTVMHPSTKYHYYCDLGCHMFSGMNLNHLDLQVQDVAATRDFFEQYFGLEVRSNPSSPAIVIMTDASGFVLVLQRAHAASAYPEGFHLGFLVDTVETVHALHARALADGRAVSEVIVNGRGTMIYLTLPEGYFVEVSCQKQRFLPRQ